MPSRLEELQRGFTRSATLAPDPAFVSAVTGGGRLSPAEAVGVYRRAYPARLTEALGETFEACWRVLGDEGFFAVCREFIALTPSVSPNLSDYGAGFPDYLRSRPDLRHAPFLRDLARLEWGFKELFHVAAHVPLSPAELAARAGAGAVLRLGDAVSLLELEHRVWHIWARDRSDETPLEPKEWRGRQRLALFKNGSNEVLVRVLSSAEYAALSALRAGLPLGSALASVPGLGAAQTERLFTFLSESGLVAAVR